MYIYIYIYINLVLSMEYPWSIFLVYNMRHNQTNHEKETLPIWLNGSAQVGFDRPLIPVLIDSLRNKRPKTSNHELDASLGPIVWWRKNPNRKKGLPRPSSGKNFPVDKNLTTLAAVEIPSISRGKVESSEFWVDACGCCFVAPWSCTRIFPVILDDMCSIYICIHLCV